jgi:hypothetical protein
MKLRPIIKKMAADQKFAEFIRDLLCRLAKDPNDSAAEECLRSYFDTEGLMLGSLCMPERMAEQCKLCTDQWFGLLSSPAYAFSAESRRKR